MRPSPYANDEYTIGWILALNDEFIVAMAMMDEEHGRPQTTPQHDTNAYYLGRIGEHNVAMASISGGQMGTGSAAVAAENMRRTFKNIRFALSWLPEKSYTGVVQHDYGKLMANGDIERKNWVCAPPRKLLAAVDILRAYHSRPKNPINGLGSIMDELRHDYAYPEDMPDHLYQADYNHAPGARACDSSDKIDQRYETSILCLEMGAAGLMNNYSGDQQLQRLTQE
ncbi:hypothetical protein BDW59DRAFT_159478 [Aspergillus cavernicola]|uniref:Uncharacterized protein n=1 Tax=Aspergillus cavernicola TaxID=176166 RepID=A0ABR4ILM8_9EURO